MLIRLPCGPLRRQASSELLPFQLDVRRLTHCPSGGTTGDRSSQPWESLASRSLRTAYNLVINFVYSDHALRNRALVHSTV